ncbi:hypothetical protein [Photorhabdus thracensis]|uniref:hypothetical protein n=1 Tax=Photorhabdus thracensis TaxID=230089 RepID=UPI000699908C|nr:hypothetical protein [Photorhabdus thracensis]
MKTRPLFPPYRQASPPRFKRWLAAGAGGVLLVSNLVALIRPEIDDASALYAMIPDWRRYGCYVCYSAGCFTVLPGITPGFISNRLSGCGNVGGANIVSRWRWRTGCWSGPLGITPDVWLSVINQSHCRPEPLREKTGPAVRLLRSFVSDSEQREIQLAKMAVNQWRSQHQESLKCTPLHCYWLGSAAVWQGFAAQMAVRFPDVVVT